MKRCRQLLWKGARLCLRPRATGARTADSNRPRRDAGHILLPAGCALKKSLSSNYIRLPPPLNNTGYFNCPQGTPQMSFPETSSRWGIWPTEVGLKKGPRKKRRAQRSVLIQGVTVDPKNVARCVCPTTDFTISRWSCHNTFVWNKRENP